MVAQLPKQLSMTWPVVTEKCVLFRVPSVNRQFGFVVHRCATGVQVQKSIIAALQIVGQTQAMYDSPPLMANSKVAECECASACLHHFCSVEKNHAANQVQ